MLLVVVIIIIIVVVVGLGVVVDRLSSIDYVNCIVVRVRAISVYILHYCPNSRYTLPPLGNMLIG